MKYKIPVLKKTAEAIADAYGITYFEASKIVGFYSSVDDPETDKLIVGDFSPVEKAAAAKGVKLNKIPGEKGTPDAKTEKPEKKPAKNTSAKSKKPTKDIQEEKPSRGAVVDGVKTSKKKAQAIQSAGGVMRVAELENVVDGLRDAELPEDIQAIIDSALNAFAEKWKIDDITKISQERWRGFCMLFGFEVNRNKLLHDIGREAREGGIRYDPVRVERLLNVWASYCQLFDKIPLAADFIAFAGIDKCWFYGDNGKMELTSKQVELAQKLQDLQEVGLSGRLIDGKRNPTGTIFFLKNWHGWKDQREIVHTDGVKAAQLEVLPDFTSGAPAGIPEKPGNADNPSS